MRATAAEVLPAILAEHGEGSKADLSCLVIAAVAEKLGLEVDEDALAGDLDPFELLTEEMGVYAETDDNGGGVSYVILRVFRLEPGALLILEDRNEVGEYAVVAEAKAIEEACPILGSFVLDRLGANPFTINEELDIDGSDAETWTDAKWVEVLGRRSGLLG